MKRFLFATVLTLFTTHAFALERISDSEAQKRLELFNYKKTKLAPKWTLLKNARRYSSWKTYLTSKDPQGNELKQEIHYYKTKFSGKRPLLLVAPAIGGQSILDRDVARYYSKRGMNVLISIRPDNVTDVKKPFAFIDTFFLRTITALRRSIDLCEGLVGCDEKRVGIFGVSLGGIAASLAMGVEPRIDASITFVAGGNLPEVIAYSEQSIVKNFRDARMKKEGFATQDGVHDYLEEKLIFDPLHFSRFRDQSEMMMFIGQKDKAVPTKNQYDLWEGFGRPYEMRDCFRGHVTTAIMYRLYLGKMGRFYQKHFQEDIEKNQFEKRALAHSK